MHQSDDATRLDHLWKQVLEDVQLQMTRATFETWMQGTKLVNADPATNCFTISTPSSYAIDWLENRLHTTIKETLERQLGDDEPVSLKFIVEPEGNSDKSHTEPPPGLTPVGSADEKPEDALADVIELVNFDPTQGNWVQTSFYAINFWLPILDTGPFNLWLTLRAYARNGRMPSIQRLADITAKGHRQTIIGRWRKKKKTGEKYWQSGWLEKLEEERIVWYRQKEDGLYAFRVLENLPVLTPTQVDLLRDGLQGEHENFLAARKIDLEEWKKLTVPTLASLAQEQEQ